VYSTCLFCNADLGSNEFLPTFPVWRRIAFDADKGRLWVVCTRCGRWNLTPLEERWEAIDTAERLFRETRLHVSTDNIGLAELSPTFDLVRIGAALLPEIASWRYGNRLLRLTPERRRVRTIVGRGTSYIARKAAAALASYATTVGLSDDAMLRVRTFRRGDAVLAPEGSSPELTIAIIEQSLAVKFPAVFGTALWIGYGGLVSYGPDYYAQGVQAAALVAKILRGARPQDLPVEGAERIDLAVNLKTADLFGLSVPRKILLRADAFRR
jgi:hypothetical protein